MIRMTFSQDRCRISMRLLIDLLCKPSPVQGIIIKRWYIQSVEMEIVLEKRFAVYVHAGGKTKTRFGNNLGPLKMECGIHSHHVCDNLDVVLRHAPQTRIIRAVTNQS